MGGLEVGFLGPGRTGGMPPFPFPLTCIDNQILTVAANQFPKDSIVPPGCPNLWWVCSIPNYQGSDVVSHRYNGDSGGNYWDNCADIPSVAASGTTAPAVAETATVSTTLIRLGLPTAKWRLGWGQIINNPTKEKGVSGSVNIGTTSAPGNTNVLHLGMAGGWDGASPSFEINAITWLTAGGSKMGVGSQIWLFAMM